MAQVIEFLSLVLLCNGISLQSSGKWSSRKEFFLCTFLPPNYIKKIKNQTTEQLSTWNTLILIDYGSTGYVLCGLVFYVGTGCSISYLAPGRMARSLGNLCPHESPRSPGFELAQLWLLQLGMSQWIQDLSVSLLCNSTFVIKLNKSLKIIDRIMYPSYSNFVNLPDKVVHHLLHDPTFDLAWHLVVISSLIFQPAFPKFF